MCDFWCSCVDVFCLWYSFIDVSFLTTGGLYDFLNCHTCWYDTWKVNYHLHFLYLKRKFLKLNKILGLLAVSIGCFYKPDTLFRDFCVRAGEAILISLANDSRSFIGADNFVIQLWANDLASFLKFGALSNNYIL